MRVIEDYKFKHHKDRVNVLWYMDTDAIIMPCRKAKVSFDVLQKAYEACGFGYIRESLNRDYTDIEEVYLGKSENEQEFMIDQMENCMTSDDVQDVLKKAIELI